MAYPKTYSNLFGNKGPQLLGCVQLVGSVLPAPFTWYMRAELPTVTKTTITIPAYTQVGINGQLFYSTDDKTLETTNFRDAGKDIYVYAVIGTDNEMDFVLSDNSTVPTGYTAENSRKIGGCHLLCADVGTIEDHPLSGYTAGDILPASVWDLRHRPRSSPEGMVYHEGKGIWVDIYLAHWDGTQLVSQYNQATADGTSSKNFHGELFTEEFGKVGKRCPWRHEFIVFAKGSPEMTAIQGAADPTTTGGHVDSNGRRIISNIGCEDCTGVLWQWFEDTVEGGAYGSYTAESGLYYLDGYNWNLAGDVTSEDAVNPVSSTYHPTIDGEGNRMGDSYGLIRRLRGGAYWDSGSRCGSRAVDAHVFPSGRSSYRGGRGVSEPLVWS